MMNFHMIYFHKTAENEVVLTILPDLFFHRGQNYVTFNLNTYKMSFVHIYKLNHIKFVMIDVFQHTIKLKYTVL